MNYLNTLSEQSQTQLNQNKALSSNSLNLKINFIDGTDNRLNTELFIKSGFDKAFNADIKNFLPILIQMGDHQPRAALGLRSARAPLFIEQYLAKPIEKIINPESNPNRFEIAELGNLYSSNRRFTIPLFMTMSVGLFLAGFKYLCFSGTDKVRALLAKEQVSFKEIKDAEQNTLQPSQDNWGDYYQHQPKVCVINLVDVMNLLEGNIAHQQKMNKLAPHINQLAVELKKL